LFIHPNFSKGYDVDLGLWKSIDKSKLIVPVDVHIGRLSRILGFHNHKTISLASAIEITESFAQIDPADPVKYDFALSRIGITEGCNGQYDLRCEGCEIFDFCHEKPVLLALRLVRRSFIEVGSPAV